MPNRKKPNAIRYTCADEAMLKHHPVNTTTRAAIINTVATFGASRNSAAPASSKVADADSPHQNSPLDHRSKDADQSRSVSSAACKSSVGFTHNVVVSQLISCSEP